MAGPDFYEILGVTRTASLDEIKSAHREQVKKYHPDLFPSPNQKARANKRLQQINEAYAVLSNPGRRRQYDSRFFQNAKVVKPTPAATKSKSAPTFRRPSAVTIWEKLARQTAEKIDRTINACRSLSRTAGSHYRNLLREARSAKQQAAAAPKSATFRQLGSIAAITRNFARRWTRWVSTKAIGVILGIIVLILVFQAVGKEPEIVTAWTLWESEVVEPSRNPTESKAVERNWQALGYHDSKAQCAESLRQRVAIDEEGGSKVFLDERSGT
ncbi:MAG TPA: J domain-containing protein, partial [Terriglobales bacterium]|nr:J domain-containing protein [Terriglobales bacterium]